MAGIFLSYAREDRGCAGALARVLEAAEHEVWWDRHIDSGEEFAAEIEAELDKADVVLVAWSKESVKSRWVRDEAAVGGDTGRLVPVTIDGTLAPMGFRQFQTLDLTDWKGAKRDARTAELLRSVERKLKGKISALAAPAPKPKRWFATPRRSLVRGIAAALVLMIVAATVIFVFNLREANGPPPKPTVALLPFTAAASDEPLRDVAAQVRDSIEHTLSQSGLPVRLLSTVPQGGATGDFLISGDLSRNADKLVANVRLDEVAHGVTVFTKHFEAGGDDARNLPERVGAQIAADLTWTGTLMMLDRRHPSDPALTAELLQQADFTGDDLQKYQINQRVAAKAPDSGFAQLGLAFYTGFVLDQLPREERANAVAAARQAGDRARALAPAFGDTYAPWCFLHSETRMAECEDRLRAGKRVDPDAPFVDSFLARFLRGVGRFDEAVELTRLSYTHDPYVPRKIGWMLQMDEFAGEHDDARELYQQGVRWWPEYKDSFFRNRVFGLLDRGDFEAGRRLFEEIGEEQRPDYRDSGAFLAALRSKSSAAMKRLCVGADRLPVMVRCMYAFATIGDQDSAFALADKLYPMRVGRTPAETERIWLGEPDGTAPLDFITSPAAAALRRDPRYLQLAQRVGLLDYWRSGRPPDFCRTHPEPICAQLRKRS